MDLYFHISLVSNRDKIVTEGILPRMTTKIHGFYIGNSKDKTSKVFLLKDIAGVEKVIDTQAGADNIYQFDLEGNPLYEVWIIDAERHLLTNNVEHEKYWYSGTYTLSDFEYVTDRVCVSNILACIPIKKNLIELKSFISKLRNNV